MGLWKEDKKHQGITTEDKEPVDKCSQHYTHKVFKSESLQICFYIALKKHFNSGHIYFPAFLIGESVITGCTFSIKCINNALHFAIFFPCVIIVVIDCKSKQIHLMSL